MDRDARTLIGRAESLLAGLDGPALEAVQALVALYGEALARVVDRADAALLDQLAEDELVGHLLLVHDLHPVPLQERVRGALETVRPYLESHGGGVELLGVEAGVARLRLRGSCQGCPSSAMTLKLAVEDAIRRAAPELERVEAEGADEPLLQLEVSDSLRDWTAVGALPQLSGGGTVLKAVQGDELLFLRVDRDTYAYRPACPACGASLADAALLGAEMACSGCGNRYDVRRAGRCVDAPQLYLQPVPLLVDDEGLVKVAVA